MSKIDERTAANMDVVLEQICQGLPHGGDHESRKHIAQRLMQSAKKGNITLERCARLPVVPLPTYPAANRHETHP
jgi:hypothetical protein